MPTINLERPITVTRGDVTQETTTLELQTPTARHFVKYGSPFTWRSMDVEDARSRPVFNEKVVGKFLADVGGVDEAAIGMLTAPDYLNARWSLLLDMITGAKPANAASPSVVALSRPIVTHAGSLSELKITTPSAKLVIATGVPFEWRQDEYDNAFVVYNDKLCMKYLVEMTGRDEIELEDIIACDWIAARNKIFTAMNSFVGSTANP